MVKMFMVAVWMILILFTNAVWMPDINAWQRVALLCMAALVACVYMACQSRVERANAPLILRDETNPEKEKPPEP